MKAYKAVKIVNGSYRSWSWNNISNTGILREALLVYKIGEKAIRKPNQGPLAAFKTKKEAESFINDNVVGAYDPPYAILCGTGKVSKAKRLWAMGGRSGKRYPMFRCVPENTIYLDNFTPLEVIE
jgi:hypothetical protein